MNPIEKFLLFVALPTVFFSSLIEAAVLARRQSYDWKAMGVSVFDLIGRSERLWRALRVRGGASGSPARRLTLAGESLGTLVLYSFGRSERQYATMMLRGHTGRICGCRHYAEVTRADLWVAAAGLVAAVLAVTLWRMP